MGQFSHPNIVKLFGVVTIGDPVSLCKRKLSSTLIDIKLVYSVCTQYRLIHSQIS